MFNRIIGTFKLDRRLFQEIECSEDATWQAFLVVAIVSIIAAIGNGLAARFENHPFFPLFFSSLVWSFIGWILWSVISLFIGTTIFKGKGDLAGMLRGIGFSYAPQVLSIIPCIGSFAGLLWSLAAGFIAVGQELSLDNLKTLITMIIGFGLFLLGHAIINSVLGGFQWFMAI